MSFAFRSARRAAFSVLSGIMTAAGALAVSGAAFAGQPVPWQMGFQKAATPVMERVDEFHDLLLILVTLISLFVLACW